MGATSPFARPESAASSYASMMRSPGIDEWAAKKKALAAQRMEEEERERALYEERILAGKARELARCIQKIRSHS